MQASRIFGEVKKKIASLPILRLGQTFGFDIYFTSLVNWGTFSEKEFRRRAIHLPEHPKHNELNELLQDEMFRQEDVSIGNLTGILTEKVSMKQGMKRNPVQLVVLPKEQSQWIRQLLFLTYHRFMSLPER